MRVGPTTLIKTVPMLGQSLFITRRVTSRFKMGRHFEFMERPFVNMAPNGTGSFCAAFGCSNRKSM